VFSTVAPSSGTVLLSALKIFEVRPLAGIGTSADAPCRATQAILRSRRMRRRMILRLIVSFRPRDSRTVNGTPHSPVLALNRQGCVTGRPLAILHSLPMYLPLRGTPVACANRLRA
jgi:hypothetical protein